MSVSDADPFEEAGHVDWPEEARAALARVRRRRARPIPTVATVRVCDVIAPDPTRIEGIGSSIEDVYKPLTGDLPLLGGEAMVRGADGQTRLVRTLRAAAPWMADATSLVAAQLDLSLWAGRPWIGLRPLLLVGGPGTGKSRWARMLAEASGCAFAQVAVGGDSDGKSLAGTARGWLGAQPALPIVCMAQYRTANPLVIVDEIDKAAPDKRAGHAHDVLLAMLEPTTSTAWYDRCLMATVNLSHVVWIATANSTATLSEALLSRFDVVRVPAPRPHDVPVLLENMMADVARRWGVPVGALPDLTAGEEQLLVAHFARTRSVRALRRGLELALARAVRDHVRVPN